MWQIPQFEYVGKCATIKGDLLRSFTVLISLYSVFSDLLKRKGWDVIERHAGINYTIYFLPFSCLNKLINLIYLYNLFSNLLCKHVLKFENVEQDLQ